MDKKFDVVIVGTGAAGLYAALNFPESVNILLVSKRELQLSNSSLAQGGVACVLDTVHDSYKLHITDTLIAGKYKNTLSAVEKRRGNKGGLPGISVGIAQLQPAAHALGEGIGTER